MFWKCKTKVVIKLYKNIFVLFLLWLRFKRIGTLNLGNLHFITSLNCTAFKFGILSLEIIH